MSFTSPLLNRHFVEFSPGGEVLVFVPSDDSFHNGEGNLSPQYFFPGAHWQVEASPDWVQMGLPPNSHGYEAQAAQRHGSVGHFGIQGSTDDPGTNAAMADMERRFCADCNKYFKRVQGLKRHVRDIHMPQRRCPFCNVKWTRPNKIKTHLMAKHAEKFTAEMLENMDALCGRRLVECLDAYDYGLTASRSMSPFAG